MINSSLDLSSIRVLFPKARAQVLTHFLSQVLPKLCIVGLPTLDS